MLTFLEKEKTEAHLYVASLAPSGSARPGGPTTTGGGSGREGRGKWVLGGYLVNGKRVGADFPPCLCLCLSLLFIEPCKELFGHTGGRNSLQLSIWVPSLRLTRKDTASNKSTQEAAVRTFHLIGGLGANLLPFVFSLQCTEANPPRFLHTPVPARLKQEVGVSVYVGKTSNTSTLN